jgi:thioredoxin reductase
MHNSTLPVVIIGGGPVGLAAAAHVVARGMIPLVLEAGSHVGAGIRRWGHVRMFSPWKFDVDSAAAQLLTRQGWIAPPENEYPTGNDLAGQYLEPLAATPELAPHIRTNARVVAVAREHHDRMKDGSRQDAAFVVRVRTNGADEDVRARAVIDASGTIERPGALGASGMPAIGEHAAAPFVRYGIPDVLGAERSRYAGRRVLVAGSGHSALNALLELATLAEDAPGTTVIWAIRRPSLGQLLGGTRQDQLEERGKLGTRVGTLLNEGRFQLVTGFRIDRVAVTPAGVIVSAGDRSLAPVDEVIAATGFRPDWSILSEVRLDLDPAVESPRALAPLIDPNVHSCGTVPPHGAEELKHPDGNLFVIGMKSYGRAPTFLMLTGYEQARSVVSAIAGDWEAARRVELVLPETGVCSTDRTDEPASCCGTPPPEPVTVAIGALRTSRAAEEPIATAPPQASCCG